MAGRDRKWERGRGRKCEREREWEGGSVRREREGCSVRREIGRGEEVWEGEWEGEEVWE